MKLQHYLIGLSNLPILFAAPIPDKSMTASSTPKLKIKSFKRTCNNADTYCDYSYAIDTNSGAPTNAAYRVNGTPASRASYSGIKAEDFDISSSWSGQFGSGDGFQTLAVTDQKVIVYPAYRDTQLVNGKVVTPDQSYQPQDLP